MRKNKEVFIDGDLVLWRCGMAVEKNCYDLMRKDTTIISDGNKRALNSIIKDIITKDWWIKNTPSVEPLSHCLALVKQTIEAIEAAVDNRVGMVVLSGAESARKKEITTFDYKANRKDMARPVYEKEIIEYMKLRRPVVVSVNGEEADDVLGRACKKGFPIATLDKDLDMIPGDHYNWLHKSRYIISEEEAVHNQIAQLLTGDSTDNIPGVPGVGPAKARKGIEDYLSAQAKEVGVDLIDLVRDQYQKAYGEDWLVCFKDNFRAITIAGALLSLDDFLGEGE